MEAEEHETSPVTDACQQLSEGLLALSARDNVPLTSAIATSPVGPAVTFSSAQSVPPFAGAPRVSQPAVAASGVYPPQPLITWALRLHHRCQLQLVLRSSCSISSL